MVTPEDILESARRLFRGTSEVDYRNAASRAFYAVLHKCQDTVDLASPFAGGTHEKFIKDLEGNRPTLNLAYILRQCKNIRVEADYHVKESFSKKRAELVFEYADSIDTCLNDLRTKGLTK
jgi:uncharacterized protein (UPF0332 family)